MDRRWRELLGAAAIGAMCAAMIAHTRGFGDGETFSPLGISGGPLSRLASRILTDNAEDAFHGGSRRDVKFRPRTALGKVVGKISEGRGGGGGAGGRVKSDKEAQATYSNAVKNWLRFAFMADPSNFNAFFIYYNYLVEDFKTIEVPVAGGEEHGEHEGHGENCRHPHDHPEGQHSGDIGGLGFGEAAAAANLYLSSARLYNELECNNAAVGLWMLFEAGGVQGGTGRLEALEKTRRGMGVLSRAGRERGRGNANLEDTKASRQYVEGLTAQIDRFLREK